MDISKLIQWMTDGLPDDQKAIVKGAIERDGFKTKAATLKEFEEYQGLVTELDGAPGAPGSREYKRWYAANFERIQAIEKRNKELEEKFGSPATQQQQQQQVPPGLSKDEIQRFVDERMGNHYAPKFGGALVTTGNLLQKHLLAGRKKPIDFVEIEKLMATNGGNMDSAYETWDQPERERISKESSEAEIERRVKEELQKRGASSHFPAAADMSPSSLTRRPVAETDKFDRNKLQNDLVNLWGNPDAAVQ